MTLEEFLSRLDTPATPEGQKALRDFYNELQERHVPRELWGDYAIEVYAKTEPSNPRWHAAYNVASNF